MPKQPKICVFGSSMIDLISILPRFPKVGETLVGRSFHMGYGGKGANQAVMAARLGARVTMITKLGRDVFGEGTLANYRAQGIDATYVMFDESRASGVAPILVDDAARNMIVIVPGANDGLSPDDARAARTAILAADVLVCQLEVPIASTLEAFRIAKSGNVRTILNPAPAAELPDELLQLTDICAPNETETELLTGLPTRTIEEAHAAAAALLARGPKVVILTLGDRGALVRESNRAEHIAPVKVNAVDPTGAGDAFVGSVAVFWAQGRPLDDAVRCANAVAALSVTCVGTQISFPTCDEADGFLRQNKLA